MRPPLVRTSRIVAALREIPQPFSVWADSSPGHRSFRDAETIKAALVACVALQMEKQTDPDQLSTLHPQLVDSRVGTNDINLS